MDGPSSEVHAGYDVMADEKKLNSVALVCVRTISTERPPLVGEVSSNFCWEGVA
jgi:hypothetical protein